MGNLILNLDVILMNLDKTVFNSGADLCIYLNQRINEKSGDDPTILGEVVKIMKSKKNHKIS
jgi:hypothetical protein